MAQHLTPATRRPAPRRAISNVATRDAFYSKLFTRLSVGVFVGIAASIVLTAFLFNQGY